MSDDLERIKILINSLIDDKSKKEFQEENEKLEISFKHLSSKIGMKNKLADKEVSSNDLILNKNDIRLITENVKREIDGLSKEIVQQEKNINQVKENLQKIEKN